MGAIVSAIVGAGLAVVAGVGLVNAASGGTPEPVTSPYIVYGSTS
jgi:hypothetical protein